MDDKKYKNINLLIGDNVVGESFLQKHDSVRYSMIALI